MAQNINTVVLTGNLTRDPELRTVGSGTALCSLRLAVNEREKSGDDWGERVNFFDVTVWGRQGETCAEYLAKGRPVAVAGRLRWREWEAEGGGKRQAVEVVADRVQFLGGGDGERREQHPATDVPADTSGLGEVSVDEARAAAERAKDDDIPF